MDEDIRQPLAAWAADAPVLMADWLLRPISSLKPGDEVIAIEPGDRAERSRLIRTVVRDVRESPATLVTLAMKSGNPVRCAADALWYTNRFPGAKDPHRKTWTSARPGAALMLIDLVECPPDPHQHRLWYWLAGMVDGEGHVGDSALPITQTTTKNGPVWEKLCGVLDELGIEYRVRRHDRGPENWQPRADAVIRNVRDVYRRLLRYADPGKREQIVAALWRRPKKPIRAHDRVVGLGDARQEPGWRMTTDAGNQIICGYAASNYALSRTCDLGHLLDLRTDSAGKTYQTCPTCGPSGMKMLANERRRQAVALKRARAFTPEDMAVLEKANEMIETGRAAAVRVAAGLTQSKLGALCEVSQPRVRDGKPARR